MYFLKKYWGLTFGGLVFIAIGINQLSKNNDEYVLNLISGVIIVCIITIRTYGMATNFYTKSLQSTSNEKDSAFRDGVSTELASITIARPTVVRFRRRL